jgi:hypothetical protein
MATWRPSDGLLTALPPTSRMMSLVLMPRSVAGPSGLTSVTTTPWLPFPGTVLAGAIEPDECLQECRDYRTRQRTAQGVHPYGPWTTRTASRFFHNTTPGDDQSTGTPAQHVPGSISRSICPQLQESFTVGGDVALRLCHDTVGNFY